MNFLVLGDEARDGPVYWKPDMDITRRLHSISTSGTIWKYTKRHGISLVSRDSRNYIFTLEPRGATDHHYSKGSKHNIRNYTRESTAFLFLVSPPLHQHFTFTCRSGRLLEETEELRVENPNCKESLNGIAVARICVKEGVARG